MWKYLRDLRFYDGIWITHKSSYETLDPTEAETSVAIYPSTERNVTEGSNLFKKYSCVSSGISFLRPWFCLRHDRRVQ